VPLPNSPRRVSFLTTPAFTLAAKLRFAPTVHAPTPQARKSRSRCPLRRRLWLNFSTRRSIPSLGHPMPEIPSRFGGGGIPRLLALEQQVRSASSRGPDRRGARERSATRKPGRRTSRRVFRFVTRACKRCRCVGAKTRANRYGVKVERFRVVTDARGCRKATG